jgi:hypothetical protein
VNSGEDPSIPPTMQRFRCGAGSDAQVQVGVEDIGA